MKGLRSITETEARKGTRSEKGGKERAPTDRWSDGREDNNRRDPLIPTEGEKE
jgi:hypothetical protein